MAKCNAFTVYRVSLLCVVNDKCNELARPSGLHSHYTVLFDAFDAQQLRGALQCVQNRFS